MPNNKSVAKIDGNRITVLRSDAQIFVSQDYLAALEGVSRQYIGRLVAQGKLEKANGKFNLLENHSRIRAEREAKEEEKTVDDEKSEALKRKSEAQLKQAKATIATLDAKERMGKMHRSEDVAAMTEDLIYAIRSALIALPGRLAVDVMEAKDSAEASEIIRTEIYKVMEELANYEYDPAKYEERVRERLRLEALDGDDSE